MPISLKRASGGGSFITTFFSGRLNVAQGVSGDVITLTAPIGKKVRLTGLVAGTAAVTGISVLCDGVSVVTNLNISQTQPTAAGSFTIGASTSTNLGQGGGSIDHFEANSTIIIRKLSGNTEASIGYSYTYGEY